MGTKIGVMIIGAKGAVATTLIAAQAAAIRGLVNGFPVPSEVEPLYQSLPLPGFSDMVFGGWDITPDSYSESCAIHGVVPKHILNDIADLLDKVDSYPAILASHDSSIEDILTGSGKGGRNQNIDYATTVFTKRPHNELVKSLEYDIADFKARHDVGKVIVVNLASTEKPAQLSAAHDSLKAFEKAVEDNDPAISFGMLYPYAAIRSGCHYINFTPSVACEIPALIELAAERKVALSGKDGKTGQTLYKTAIAPMFKHRALRLKGWYSTNILGNRDGQVLKDPEHRASKIGTKTAVLSQILGYDNFDHQVHIHYYLPRGDAKEAWDVVDFQGWFGTNMQMKINWLGDDSILAAPLVYDLIRWTDYFSERGEYGVLVQLASYFKHPMGTNQHDYYQQIDMLKQHILKSKP